MPEVPRVLEIPARGTSTAVFESNVFCNWAVDVSIIAPASSTSTTVLTVPTSNLRCAAVVWASPSLTSGLVAVSRQLNYTTAVNLTLQGSTVSTSVTGEQAG